MTSLRGSEQGVRDTLKDRLADIADVVIFRGGTCSKRVRGQERGSYWAMLSQQGHDTDTCTHVQC